MTCREKLKADHLDWDDARVDAGIAKHGCPHYYKYLNAPSWCTCGGIERDCEKCWDREIPDEDDDITESVNKELDRLREMKTNTTIKDSGDRTEFPSGAVRDMHEGKGRMDLLPWAAIMEVSKHCENGAKKYGEHNVDKGIPTSSLCDSAARHLAKYLDGWTDEDHLLASAWNLLWAIQMRIKNPDLVNTPWQKETSK